MMVVIADGKSPMSMVFQEGFGGIAKMNTLYPVTPLDHSKGPMLNQKSLTE